MSLETTLELSLEKPSTPCIGACKIDPVAGLCRGCGRTRDEIIAWKNLTEPERLEIMRGLALRAGFGAGFGPGFSSAERAADGREFTVNLKAHSGEGADQSD
jgi:predicted Fe-S protein YdhL (DUF1289 family)